MMTMTTVVEDDPSLDAARTYVSVTSVESARSGTVTSSAGAVSSSAGSTACARVEVDASGTAAAVVEDDEGGVESLYRTRSTHRLTLSYHLRNAQMYSP